MAGQVPSWVEEAIVGFFSPLLSRPAIMAIHSTSSGYVVTVGDGLGAAVRPAFLAWVSRERGVVAFSGVGGRGPWHDSPEAGQPPVPEEGAVTGQRVEMPGLQALSAEEDTGDDPADTPGPEPVEGGEPDAGPEPGDEAAPVPSPEQEGGEPPGHESRSQGDRTGGLYDLIAGLERRPGGRPRADLVRRLAGEGPGLDVHSLQRASGLPRDRVASLVAGLIADGILIRRGRRVAVHPRFLSPGS